MKGHEFKLTDYLAFKPEEGKIQFRDQRMVLMSADSFGCFLKEIIDLGGMNLARVLIRRFGEEDGKHNAKVMKKKFQFDSEMDTFIAGTSLAS
jgi:hypothetical protein